MMVRRRGDWLIAKVEDEFVMMSRQKVHHIGVTEVSPRIWELIETPQEIDTVCEQLRKEYVIPPDVCRAEVVTFLNELAEHGAVTLDPPTPVLDHEQDLDGLMALRFGENLCRSIEAGWLYRTRRNAAARGGAAEEN